jgi:hypothetical protein
MTKFFFFTNLVKEVGGIFKPPGVTPDGVGNDNARATPDDGDLATGGLVACSKPLSHFHLPTGCGSRQLV